MNLKITEENFPQTYNVSKSDDGAVLACIVTQPGVLTVDHLTILQFRNTIQQLENLSD